MGELSLRKMGTNPVVATVTATGNSTLTIPAECRLKNIYIMVANTAPHERKNGSIVSMKIVNGSFVSGNYYLKDSQDTPSLYCIPITKSVSYNPSTGALTIDYDSERNQMFGQGLYDGTFFTYTVIAW